MLTTALTGAEVTARVHTAESMGLVVAMRVARRAMAGDTTHIDMSDLDRPAGATRERDA